MNAHWKVCNLNIKEYTWSCSKLSAILHCQILKEVWCGQDVFIQLEATQIRRSQTVCKPAPNLLTIRWVFLFWCSGIGNVARKWSNHLVVWETLLVKRPMGVKDSLTETVINMNNWRLSAVGAPTWEDFQLLDYNNYWLLGKNKTKNKCLIR